MFALSQGRITAFALALFAILASARAGSETQLAPPELMAPGEWPTTVDATVKDILSKMSEKDKEFVRNTNLGDLIKFHHGWGTGIRNYYGLWRGNEALISDACGQPCHPDGASMKIIYAVWHALQK